MEAVGFDAPEVDLSGASGDEGLELETAGGEGEQAGEGEGGEATAEEGGEGEHQQAGPFRAVENGRLTKATKDFIEQTKATNPQLAKAIQRALFAEDRLRSELPNGFKDLAALRGQLEQLGGDTGIADMQDELKGFREFDDLFVKGDPGALEFLTKSPEAQEAFLKIAPLAFEKYREMHPEAYSSYVSQVFAGDMQKEQVPMNLQLLASVLGRAQFANEADAAEGKRLVQALAGYVNRIDAWASKEVKLPERAAAPDKRISELDTREQNLTRQEWRGEADRQHGSIFQEAWKRLVAPALPQDRAKAEAATKLIKRLYDQNLNEKIAAKKDVNGTFDEKVNRYFAAKDKQGFLRTHESAFKEAVPLALRSAMAEAGISRKAPAQQNGQQRAATPAAKTPAVPAGFKHVAKAPESSQVNKVMTGPEMWLKKQAYLKSGERVCWD